ncbi:hypothetical protein AB0911_12200 [Streptomyces nigra]|uniref:hypothetical protein n=1 Tax=Streptomyces nigra TaxID=1827580 RepID=UPI0034561627
MTPSEIQTLVCGIVIGAQSMAALNAYWASKDATRAATEAQAALKQSAGDRYLNSFRSYRLQHRSRV